MIRDRKTIEMLRRLGWSPLIVWECNTRNHNSLKRRLSKFLIREGNY